MPDRTPSARALLDSPPPHRLMQRRDTAWRAPLAAACVIAAAAHVPVTGEHLQEALYIGVLFVLLEVACIVLAIAVVRAPSDAVLLATAVVGALAVAAFVVSRTAGLPLIGDDVGEWTEPLAVVSVAAEAVMVVGGLLGLAAARRSAPRLRAAGSIGGVALLAAGALAIGVAVLPTGASAQEGHGHGTSEHGTDGHEMSGMDMSGMDMSEH